MTNSIALNLSELPFRKIIISEIEKVSTSPDEDVYIEEFSESSKQTVDRLEQQISPWVYSVARPEKWDAEEISPPTVECKNKTESTVLNFYKNFQLYPTRISASIEEGIFIKYINHENQKELSIEIYNDLDIAAIITRHNEILFKKDISDESFSEVHRVFHSP